MCTLLTVADSAGARPREAGTERWPSLIDFCCFRHHLKGACLANQVAGRKLLKSIKGRQAKGVQGLASSPLHLYTANTVGQYR